MLGARTIVRAHRAGQLCAPCKGFATCRPLGALRSSRRVIEPVCFRENDKSVSKEVEKKAGETASKVSHEMSGFLSSCSTQSQSYWTLGTIAAATAVVALAAPSLFASTIFQTSTDAVVDTMVRMTGATLITSAATKYTLKEASAQGDLPQDTFKRLNIALMVQCALSLVVLAQGISVRTPLLVGFLGAICGSGFLLSSRVYSLSKGGIPFPSLKHTFSAMISTLMPTNLAATGYSLLTVALVGMAAMGITAAPGESLPLYNGVMGPVTVFMRRVAGAGMLLMAMVAFSLKEGADKGKLGTTPMRWLNLGMSGSLLAMLLVMTVNLQSGLMLASNKAYIMMAAILTGFTYTGYQYVAGTDLEAKSA